MEVPEFLQGFFYAGQHPIVPIAHDPYWVGFSVLTAIVGSIVGFKIADLSKQIKHKLTRRSMQIAGAVSFGVTVWSMHFTGMLAVSIPVSMSYYPWTTLLSVFPAIIAAWFAIRWRASKKRSVVNRLTTALLIALGIGTMHYTGMLAMQLDALLRFEIYDFFYSLLIALCLSYAGIWADEILRAKNQYHYAHLVGGALLGLAITGMHYEAMKSVRIVASIDIAASVSTAYRSYLGAIIFLGVIAAIGIGLSGSLLAKLRINFRELEVRRQQLQTIIKNGLNAVIVVNSENKIESINNETVRLFNVEWSKVSGESITKVLPSYTPPQQGESAIQDSEITGFKSDGTEIQLLMRAINLSANDTVETIIYLMDISEFRNAERELYHQATHDGLTGIFNRRHLDACAEHEYDYFLRNKRPLSVLMFDLDHFKHINDSYGHDFGDLVLKMVAQECSKVLRKSDLFFRSGGEEFVVLLPDTTKTDALIIAEKLRHQVEAQHVSSHAVSAQVTISIGVSTTETDLGGGVSELLTRADEAMYRSKHDGRNRSTHFDAITPQPSIVKN